MALHHNIKILRNLHGLTQFEVASGINMKRTTYRNIESGARVPDIFEAQRIAQFFYISVDSLLNFKMAGDDEVRPFPIEKLDSRDKVIVYKIVEAMITRNNLKANLD